VSAVEGVLPRVEEQCNVANMLLAYTEEEEPRSEQIEYAKLRAAL
jgi:C4-type Zn-finger protein